MKLNEQQLKKVNQLWLPKIKAKLDEKGIKVSESKLQTIAKMAHARTMALNENTNGGYATLDSAFGRGGVSFGNNPNAGLGGFYGNGAKGSAEVWQQLFGVFVEIAATNIGFELVPMVLATKASGTFYVAEPVYGGGRTDSAGSKPWLVQVKLTTNGTIAADKPLNEAAVGTTYTVTEGHNGDDVVDLVYVGRHRVTGHPIFQVGQCYDNTGTGGTNYKDLPLIEVLDTAGNSARIPHSTPASGNYYGFETGSVDLVDGFVNFSSGFSGAGLNDSDDWFMNRGDGKRYSKPMSRKTGERTYSRSMGIRTWSKNYAADTVKTNIFYTTEQIQDMQNDLGISAFEFGDMTIKDQLNQHINGHILGRLFALGWEHHYQMNKINGFNMNAYISSAANTGSAQSFLGKDDTLKTIAGAAGVLPSSGAISENLSSLQRRVITRMLYGSGIVKTKSRRSRADQSVMNTTFATAVRDIRGFEPSPFDNTIDANTDMELLGTLYGMRVYEDGLMDLTDKRIYLGRKGNEKDPGVKFINYILAEKISTMAEGTMAQKDQIISRYQLLEAGSYPELNSLTFVVESEDNGYQLV